MRRTVEMVDGAMFCRTHLGFCVEGTDYTGSEGSGCQYPAFEHDEPCRLVSLYVDVDQMRGGL